jgi:hypothetical protein
MYINTACNDTVYGMTMYASGQYTRNELGNDQSLTILCAHTLRATAGAEGSGGARPAPGVGLRTTGVATARVPCNFEEKMHGSKCE